MNKAERKYFNTALLMDAALLALLEEKEFSYITVKEICARAGVNRSTFYLHYETIGDLLSETLEQVDRKFWSSFQAKQKEIVGNISSVPPDRLIFIDREYLIPYLTFIKENRSIYLAAHKNPSCMNSQSQYEKISKTVLQPILERFQIERSEQCYWIAFYVQGACAIVSEWIRNGYRESAEELADIMTRCIRPRPNEEDHATFPQNANNKADPQLSE